MKKVVAVVFSDLHINDWSKFNQNSERTKNHFKVLSIVKKACWQYNCPALFCGDMFHKPENMSLELLNMVSDYFRHLELAYRRRPFHIYCISGNHEMTQALKIKPLYSDPPISWVSIFARTYSFIQCIDFQSKELSKNLDVYGIPYIDHNIGLNEYIKALNPNPNKNNILLLHTDYPGAKDTDGSEVGTSENLNTNLLDKFNLTLIGHIHKPQRLSKKAYMVGAPLQQRRTDRDCDLGYWLIYEDMTVKFISLSDQFPKFIDVDSEDKIKDDGNYYTVVSKKVEASVEKINHISKKLSKKRIVKRYLKEKGIADPKKESILLDIIKESEND